MRAQQKWGLFVEWDMGRQGRAVGKWEYSGGVGYLKARHNNTA